MFLMLGLPTRAPPVRYVLIYFFMVFRGQLCPSGQSYITGSVTCYLPLNQLIASPHCLNFVICANELQL